MKKFTELGLSQHNIHTLLKKGFEEPTEIQTLTIPLFLTKDIETNDMKKFILRS